VGHKEEGIWKERNQKVLALIPLDLDGYVLSGQWESGKSSYLTSRFVGDFTAWEEDNAKFETGVEKLVKALRADDGAREKPPEPKL